MPGYYIVGHLFRLIVELHRYFPKYACVEFVSYRQSLLNPRFLGCNTLNLK